MNAVASGPIRIPRELESPDIRRAPAYDREAARAYIPAMPALRRLIDSVSGDDIPHCFGKASPSPASMQRLQAALDGLLADGHHASFILVDLKSQSGVSFNTSTPFCTQSTIKAIYVGALLEKHPEALRENGQHMRDAIVLSSNIAYESLRAIYGDGCIRAWCNEAGVDASMAAAAYPRDKTARDMLKLWTRLYCFLNGDDDPDNFGAYYADSIVSATHERLGARCPMQTKAGWENGLPEDQPYDPNAVIPLAYRDNDPLNDECAINDTGIVYTPQGPYLFVIYSDWPFGIFPDYIPANPLDDLAEALYAVQQSLHERSEE